MNDNLALESHPVNYVNDPAVIAQNDNMIRSTPRWKWI